MTSSLKHRATFSLGPNGSVRLIVAQGSVIEFGCDSVSSTSSAIVNAANEGCLGGGGVDGAIGDAGGSQLAQDRLNLPVVAPGIRCRTGGAVLTGPGDYGSLHVPYVVHAVGPNYIQYDSFAMDCSTDEDGSSEPWYTEPDELLRSAYQATLDICHKTGAITDIGFSLLSAGIFRGDRSLEEVLQAAVVSIRDWFDEQPIRENKEDKTPSDGGEKAAEEKTPRDSGEKQEEEKTPSDSGTEGEETPSDSGEKMEGGKTRGEKEDEENPSDNGDEIPKKRLKTSTSGDEVPVATNTSIKSITLCGFSPKECQTLLDVCSRELSNAPSSGAGCEVV